MAAARVLGELGSKEAVPKLLVVLEDADSAVRETAWIALRLITGKDFKFDPYANEAERAKRVRAWTDWWKKEGGGGDVSKPPSGT
jgi:HEAT repeat protein